MFYAIGIIITAYLPIFTLQRVEGRLFKPMAWTVAFALLGALLFSMLIAPVLASSSFGKGAQRMAQPADDWLTSGLSQPAVRQAIRVALGHGGVCSGGALALAVLSAQRRHRFGVSAASG